MHYTPWERSQNSDLFTHLFLIRSLSLPDWYFRFAISAQFCTAIDNKGGCPSHKGEGVADGISFFAVGEGVGTSCLLARSARPPCPSKAWGCPFPHHRHTPRPCWRKDPKNVHNSRHDTRISQQENGSKRANRKWSRCFSCPCASAVTGLLAVPKKTHMMPVSHKDTAA